jgi:hypothetical protein
VSPWPREAMSPATPRAPLAARARRLATLWLGRAQATAFVAPDVVWELPGDNNAARGAPRPHADVSAWLATQAGENVHVVLSSRCSKSLLIDASTQNVAADDSAALEALARAELMQVWGPDAAAWPLRTWSGQRMHGACAWSDAQAEAWLTGARTSGTRFKSLLPWWSVALQRLCGDHPTWGHAQRSGLLICECVHATWLVGHDGELIVLRQRRIDEPTLGAVAALCAQCRATDDVSAASTFVVGYGLHASAGGVGFGGEQICGTLDGAAPEASWLVA